MTDIYLNDGPGSDGAVEALAGYLATEEEALEDLLFRLQEQQLMLRAGETRWLRRTTAEVTGAVVRLRAVSGAREAATLRAHAAAGLSEDASLLELIDWVSDNRLAQVLRLRRQSVRDVLDLVNAASASNRQLLASGLAATEDALALLGRAPTYGSDGSKTSTIGSQILDTRV